MGNLRAAVAQGVFISNRELQPLLKFASFLSQTHHEISREVSPVVTQLAGIVFVGVIIFLANVVSYEAIWLTRDVISSVLAQFITPFTATNNDVNTKAGSCCGSVRNSLRAASSRVQSCQPCVWVAFLTVFLTVYVVRFLFEAWVSPLLRRLVPERSAIGAYLRARAAHRRFIGRSMLLCDYESFALAGLFVAVQALRWGNGMSTWSLLGISAYCWTIIECVGPSIDYWREHHTQQLPGRATAEMQRLTARSAVIDAFTSFSIALPLAICLSLVSGLQNSHCCDGGDSRHEGDDSDGGGGDGAKKDSRHALWEQPPAAELVAGGSVRNPPSASTSEGSLSSFAEQARTARGSGGGGGSTIVGDGLSGLCCVCISSRAVMAFVHHDVIHKCLCEECERIMHSRTAGAMTTCLMCRQPAVRVTRVVEM